MKEVFELFKTSKKELTRDSIIIDILYSTGLRRAELINLKKSDIYFDDQVIKVLGKRNKERLVPMLPGLVKKLKLYSINIKEDSFLLQSKNGNKISPSTIYRVVNKYLRSISTKTKISPHVLRHTFATHILNNGADINSIKEILGVNPDYVISPGTYDQKHIERIGKLKNCVAYGPGILDLAHQPDEYISVNDMLDSAKVMALSLEKMLI